MSLKRASRKPKPKVQKQKKNKNNYVNKLDKESLPNDIRLTALSIFSVVLYFAFIVFYLFSDMDLSNSILIYFHAFGLSGVFFSVFSIKKIIKNSEFSKLI